MKYVNNLLAAMAATSLEVTDSLVNDIGFNKAIEKLQKVYDTTESERTEHACEYLMNELKTRYIQAYGDTNAVEVIRKADRKFRLR
jgi:hypothetical protein